MPFIPLHSTNSQTSPQRNKGPGERHGSEPTKDSKNIFLNGNGAMPGGSIKRKSTTETKQALRHCCWRAIFKKGGRGEQALLLKK
jgi:hypothetical protein